MTFLSDIVSAEDIFMPFIKIIPEPIRWGALVLIGIGIVTWLKSRKK